MRKCAACGYVGGFMDVHLVSVHKDNVYPQLVPHDGSGAHDADLVACPKCQTVQVECRHWEDHLKQKNEAKP